jgi:hypothetical protein
VRLPRLRVQQHVPDVAVVEQLQHRGVEVLDAALHVLRSLELAFPQPLCQLFLGFVSFGSEFFDQVGHDRAGAVVQVYQVDR